MAKHKRRSSKKSTGARGKSVKLGGRMYKCRAKRVRSGRGRGRGKHVRAYCRRAKK